MVVGIYNRFKNIFFKTAPKTFLEQINSTLILGKLFGCIFFSIKEEPLYINVIFHLPILVLYTSSTIYYALTYNEQSYNRTKILYTFELLQTSVRNITLIVDTVYLLYKRKQHRKIILNMQELNKLLGTEKKQYPLINYAFLRSIACLLIMELCLFTAALNAIADKIKGSSGGHVSNYLGITMILLKIYTIWLLLEENKQQYSILNGQILNLPRSITRWNIKEKIGHLSKLIKLYRTLTKFSMSLNEFFARIISVEIIQMFILIIWTLDGLFVSLSCFVNGIGSDFNSMVAVILSRVIFGILYLQYNIRKWINIADEVSIVFKKMFSNADADTIVFFNSSNVWIRLE